MLLNNTDDSGKNHAENCVEHPFSVFVRIRRAYAPQRKTDLADEDKDNSQNSESRQVLVKDDHAINGRDQKAAGADEDDLRRHARTHGFNVQIL